MKNKVLNLLTKMGLMGAILLSTTATASEADRTGKRESAGNRALKPFEHVAIQEKRIENNGLEKKEQGVQKFENLQKVEFTLDETRAKDDESQEQQGDKIKKSFISKDLYYTTHQGIYHSTYAITVNGDMVELEDGSCWSVSYWDRSKVFSWLSTDRIIISQNTNIFSSHYYRLINLETGQKVAVNLKIKPFYNGYYTRWIVAIDYLQNVVYLSDGSIWSMDHYDHTIISTWLPNDTVIIGVNASSCSSCPANILINAETLEYGCGNCIN